MSQLIVRGLEDSVKAQLQRRARLNGRSMEEEIRNILRGAIGKADRHKGGLGSEISALFAEIGLKSNIPELRGHGAKPALFKR